MSVFVDTTAFYALVDADDASHGRAVATWRELAESSEPVFTHHLVVVESIALVQSRIGLDAVRDLVELVDATDTFWIGAEDHRIVLAALMASGRRRVSYVDQASFHVMRTHAIRGAFAFDRHFADEGFALVPPAARRRGR